jgi:transcriptional regulator with XRE-family HTH domain
MRLLDDGEVSRIAVRFLRGFRGWSQAELAAAAQIDPSAVSRYESGDQVPTRRTMLQLAAAAGLSPVLLASLLAWIRAALAAGKDKTFDRRAEAVEAAAAELTEALAELVRKT